MRTQKRHASVVGLILAAVMLASCGGGGEREALEAMIRAATVDTGPGSCLEYETLHFLESMYGREGEAAVRACEESALDPLDKQPRSVDVSEIDIAGDSAAAVIGFEGSLFDGQTETPREAENVSCWIGRMEGMSDEALEELLFGDRDVSAHCTAKSKVI